MTLLNPTTVLVGLLLLYLSSFIVFAIVRIATGVSIQRIGYFSLRRISYAPKEGMQIDIRGLGLSLHRPSFSRPTWVSLRLTDLKVTLNPYVLDNGWGKLHDENAFESQAPSPGMDSPSDTSDKGFSFGFHQHQFKPRSKAWKRLTGLKERIKRLHRQIHWLAMVDVVAVNTTVQFVDAGLIQVGSFSMAVDTRRKMVDRGKLFRHKKDYSSKQRPAEWMITIRNVLLVVDGREPMELLDNLQLNIHGHLYNDLEGLRDTSVAVKIGRLHVPYDDLMIFSQKVKQAKQSHAKFEATEIDDEISFADFVEELDRPGSREEAIVQTVADSKEFASSLLRGIEEVQVALSFFRVSRSFSPLPVTRNSLYLNVVTHEIGIDLHRMDPKSPAHRMYFQRDDVAHQALLAAISLSVSLDDSSGRTDKILYIPMATTTIKTTLPSKTVSFYDDHDPAERNTNVLFANLVITSPSVDLEPHHVSHILRLAQMRAPPSSGKRRDNHQIISRLLPKASIKLSVHEPVLRFVLPIPIDSTAHPDDYNILVSSISSISLDVESSHSEESSVQYSLSSVYRVASHNLYYQTPAGVKHNLLQTETMEIKVRLNASPELYVTVSGSLNSFSLHLINAEVNRGIRQVIEQFRVHMQPKTLRIVPEERKPCVLRRLPVWLARVQFEASGFSIEVAGVDTDVSKTSRGVTLQLESWTADYRAQKVEPPKAATRRRTPSHSAVGDESFKFPPTSPPKKVQNGRADGRRLAFHVRGLEGFAIESEDYMEPESFLSLPRCEVALSTQSDLQGPIFHINSVIKGLHLDFSLYRYYSLGVASSILRDTFVTSLPGVQSPATFSNQTRHFTGASLEVPHLPSSPAELTTVDVRVTLVQIKAIMPADPPMMLQIYGLAAGCHRWSSQFLRCNLLRLHAEAPRLKGIWARVISMNSVRLDLRQSKQKQGRKFVEERSIDLSADFIRLGVPHHMVMHRIFDNIVNTTKALKQLNHRFKIHVNENLFEKHSEGPKTVPKISLRSKALLFELEDDAFEWKLGCIYRAGLVEQRHRLAREDAFRLKVQKLKEADHRRGSSRFRARSTHTDSPLDSRGGNKRRSTSADDLPRDSFESRGRKGRKRYYDAEGYSHFSSFSKIPSEDAWHRLQEHNARSWKIKIDSAMQFQAKSIRDIRALFTGADEPPEDVEDDEKILAIPDRPGLMSALISDVNLVIDKPTFPLSEYAQYLHKIGKGMPLDMKYALLVPMSLQLNMGEARVSLRDYPLDLLHIPALRPGQSPKQPSWSLRTNFVIAEEFRDHKSSREVNVGIVPRTKLPDGSLTPGLSVVVQRTVSPVKTYSDPVFDINTSLPTSITWCMSYQPVIQDMMRTIESFTKPEVDPSERVGFWDKIRLSFHSRIKVLWKSDGDVHLRLKGSRDPYIITGMGAGFVMCWRKDVKWEINMSNDPREFMTVTSGEYALAIPDFVHEARSSYEFAADDSASTSTDSSIKESALFKKVVMKLSGSVRWLAGLVFERNVSRGRSFEFKPHYEVVLRNPKYIDQVLRKDYDAFSAFRSNYIHLSLAVSAPISADSASSSQTPPYNTVHLTPRFFTHFYSWWSLFSGVMSLPVRQGPLWPGPAKTSKKFSRHLATVKYKLLLSPLFVAHVYKHSDLEDSVEESVTATGLKVRLASFKLDLHQRREGVNTPAKAHLKQTKSSAMQINQAELDFRAADFRAVSASIHVNSKDGRNAEGGLSPTAQPVPSIDVSRFVIPDQDLRWIDMDDFVELDWFLPQDSATQTQILPLAYTPRFTYFRQTDHEQVTSDESGLSQFGDEPTHECVMSQDNEPRKVQMELLRDRLNALEIQSQNHQLLLSEHELKLIRNGSEDPELKVKHDLLVRQAESLARRRAFVAAALRRLEDQLSTNVGKEGQSEHSPSPGISPASDGNGDDHNLDEHYTPDDGFCSDFNNRFIIHNIQLKWNNSLRNIILRYIHQVSQRRGFVYYMSRRAVKFIIDIVEEQGKHKRRRTEFFKDTTPSSSAVPLFKEEDNGNVEDRIEQLLNDAKRYVNADVATADSRAHSKSADFSDNISSEFTPQNSYHIRLVAPQIQLQSNKNPKSVILVAAKGMQLKVLSIMDKGRVTDDVSGLVQRRFSLEMDGAQFFVATQRNLKAHLQFYAGNKYGNSPGSAWPPWLTLEAMFDFELNPFGFSRIIRKTSGCLRYDKYNNLRLKYNEEVAQGVDSQAHSCHGEGRMDQIRVDFPHVRAICDSSEYYSMYIIVLDLLLYSEPLEKVRSERLEKIMLASDFSDLRGAPEMVYKLQERIRQLEEIKEYFQVQVKDINKHGFKDRMSLEQDLTNCEDELFFIMKAITTSQRRNDDRTLSQTNGILRWCLSASEVVWHLMRDQNEQLVEFQLRNAAYERTDNSDGSNHNSIEVERLNAFNLLPNAVYPQMIVPYIDQKGRSGIQDVMLRVNWYMLEAVAGIPVLDEFEVNLFPLKIQLERELGKKLFEYIFPGVGASAFESGSFSPFIVKHMKPPGNDGHSDEDMMPDFVSTPMSTGSQTGEEPQSSPGLEVIEQRLQPTLSLPDQRKSKKHLSSRFKGLTMTPLNKGNHQPSPPQDRGHLSRRSTTGAPSKKRSVDSLRALARQATEINLSGSSTGDEKSKKFSLTKSSHQSKQQASDDLSQMMSRASNYMILAHVKINDVVLCLSYKGKGERNIEDIHDFVFRLPVLEYQNKTWSNLELALRLKKDVIKALISHTPAILGNKISHPRPTKQQRLRQLTSSQIISNSDSSSNIDVTRGLESRDSMGEVSGSISRRSFSSNVSPFAQSISPASSNPSSRPPSVVVSESQSVSGGDIYSREHDNTRVRPSMVSHSFSADRRPESQNGLGDEDDESRKKTIRNIGRKLLGSRT